MVVVIFDVYWCVVGTDIGSRSLKGAMSSAMV